MLSKGVVVLLYVSWVASEIYPVKQHQNERRQSPINLICGSNPVDCGGGQCCFSGQKCIKGSNGDLLCEDLLLTDVGGGPMTFYANPYSAIVGGFSSNTAALTSFGLTASTIPSTTLLPGATLVSNTFTESTTSVVIPTFTGLPATATSTTSKGGAVQVRPMAGAGAIIKIVEMAMAWFL